VQPRSVTSRARRRGEGRRLRTNCARTVRTAVCSSTAFIRHHNYYQTGQAAASNEPALEPVGLGLMGMQDVFSRSACPRPAEAREFDVISEGSPQPPRNIRRIGRGPRPAPVSQTHAARGRLKPQTCGEGRTPHTGPSAGTPADPVAAHGLRNSLLVEIRPTATPHRSPRSPAHTSASKPQGCEPVQARTLRASASRSTDTSARNSRPSGLWDRMSPRPDQARRGLRQGHRRTPDDVRELSPTPAWELPQRALIDPSRPQTLAVHRPSRSRTQTSSWPTPRSRSCRRSTATRGRRPQDHVLPALAPATAGSQQATVPRQAQPPRRSRRADADRHRCLAGDPKPVRRCQLSCSTPEGT